MTHAVPSDIATLNTNSDGFTDRMYVGDMARQLLRFDIINGQPSGTLLRVELVEFVCTHRRH